MIKKKDPKVIDELLSLLNEDQRSSLFSSIQGNTVKNEKMPIEADKIKILKKDETTKI